MAEGRKAHGWIVRHLDGAVMRLRDEIARLRIAPKSVATNAVSKAATKPTMIK